MFWTWDCDQPTSSNEIWWSISWRQSHHLWNYLSTRKAVSESCWMLVRIYQVQGDYRTKNGNLVVWVIYGITFGWLARIKIHHRNSLWSMLWNGMSYSRFVVRCSGGILLHGLIFIWTKFKSSLNHHHWSLGYSCSHNHGSGKWVHPIWVFPKIGVSQNGWLIMENPIKMDDLEWKPTIFGNIHISFLSFRAIFHWTGCVDCLVSWVQCFFSSIEAAAFCHQRKGQQDHSAYGDFVRDTKCYNIYIHMFPVLVSSTFIHLKHFPLGIVTQHAKWLGCR